MIDEKKLIYWIKCNCNPYGKPTLDYETSIKIIDFIEKQQQRVGEWIPVSERLPEDCVPVNVTWINRNPEPYYEKIKDVHFSGTAVYYNGRWFWWSATCVDYLKEYGKNDIDLVDDDIDVIAWMPLPNPYRGKEV